MYHGSSPTIGVTPQVECKLVVPGSLKSINKLPRIQRGCSDGVVDSTPVCGETRACMGAARIFVEYLRTKTFIERQREKACEQTFIINGTDKTIGEKSESQ